MTKKLNTPHSTQSCHPDIGGNSLAIHTTHSPQPIHANHSINTIPSPQSCHPDAGGTSLANHTTHSTQSCHPDAGGNSLAIHTIHSPQPHSPQSPTILSSRRRRVLTRNSHNPLNTTHSTQSTHHNLVIPTQEGTH